MQGVASSSLLSSDPEQCTSGVRATRACRSADTCTQHADNLLFSKQMYMFIMHVKFMVTYNEEKKGSKGIYKERNSSENRGKREGTVTHVYTNTL